MSTKKDSSVIVFATALTAAVVVTAVTSYSLTKRNEEKKQRAIVARQYQREKLLKEKTAAARLKNHEPQSGKLLEDVKLDKVYLWQCEDLRTKFPMANVENKMKCRANPVPSIRSPGLRRPSSVISSEDSSSDSSSDLNSLSHQVTNYNKLITDHECILGDIVRKPNGETHTVSYMRAGPRRLLHFDPATVNAAIVTCGGLCPGLNNVIREITKTLHQIYGIDGTVWGIQGMYRIVYRMERKGDKSKLEAISIWSLCRTFSPCFSRFPLHNGVLRCTN
jgi:6-phosphofructokinase 1